MNLFAMIKIAIRSILKKRMRSFLTMLGIIIGVGAVIIMLAVGQGAQQRITADIASLGTNLIMIFPGEFRPGGVSQGAGSYNRLTLLDVDVLHREATLISHISPLVQSRAQIIGGENNWSTSIMGVNADYPFIRNWSVSSGSFLSDRDIRGVAAVAVVGKTIVDNLFPNRDPVGMKIRVRNVPFIIIGVLDSKGQNSAGMDQDDLIVVPYTTALYKLQGGRYIGGILASAASQEGVSDAVDEMTGILREAHRLKKEDDDDFMIRTQTEIASFVSSTTQILTALLASIAGVSLLVGGIGIMNIMLVSVTERTKEIGIRLAVGARSSDVLVQFLIEAVVLSLLGGTFGILFGIGVAQLITKLSGLQTLVSPAVVALAFTFSGAVGVFFGFYPARNAAKLNPIDALRYE